MSIKKYEAFIKVIELGSLTRAAEALGYTQSGVSHMLSSLEAELGFSLLSRSRSGVRLTDDGERVLPAMRGILNSSEWLSQIVASIHGLDSGSVRIGTFTSVAVHWLPGIIKEFQAEYPNVDLKLLNGDYYDVEHWINEGSVDLGFITAPNAVECECIPLKEDRLMAVVPLEHRFASLPHFPLSHIASEPFISLLEGSDHDARRALESVAVKPNIKFTTKDDYAIIAMVEQGLGISILPELLLKGRNERVKILELAPAAKRTISLAVPALSKASPATLKFSEHIRRWVRDNA